MAVQFREWLEGGREGRRKLSEKTSGHERNTKITIIIIQKYKKAGEKEEKMRYLEEEKEQRISK